MASVTTLEVYPMTQTIQITPVTVPPVRYASEKVVSEITGIPRSTLQKDRHFRRGIPYSKFGKTVRYSLADVQSFMDGHKINHTDQ